MDKAERAGVLAKLLEKISGVENILGWNECPGETIKDDVMFDYRTTALSFKLVGNYDIEGRRFWMKVLFPPNKRLPSGLINKVGSFFPRSPHYVRINDYYAWDNVMPEDLAVR